MNRYKIYLTVKGFYLKLAYYFWKILFVKLSISLLSSRLKRGGNLSIKDIAEECKPFFLADFTIFVSVDFVENGIILGLFHKIGLVYSSVTVGIKNSELLFSQIKGLLSGNGNLVLLLRGKIFDHRSNLQLRFF